MISDYSKDFAASATAGGFDADEDKQQFNSQRLSPDKISQNNFVDISDGYANEGMVITFDPIHVKGAVSFKAFITSYTETFSSDFASEQVFGRIDPIHTFKQTSRNGTISFVIPSSTASEAYQALYKVDKLRSMLYPSYVHTGNALTINQNPLIRIGVMNLLTNGKVSNNYKKLFGAGGVPDFEMEGALTVINNMTVNFNLEGDAGVFEAGGITRAPKKGVLPKLIEIAIDFSVIHEENMGRETGELDKIKTVYGTSQKDHRDDVDVATASRETSYNNAVADQKRAEKEGREAASQATKDARIAQFASAMRGRREIYKSMRSRDSDTVIDSLRVSVNAARDTAILIDERSDIDIIEDEYSEWDPNWGTP